jgi:23S rRNA (adenine2503-C2)-methyltransferase
LQTADGKKFESVLMANRKEQWTICVSSQIGCAMRCTFCATGTMGLKRSMTADEIMDQYRFWTQFLAKKPELPQRISNIVFMGMGEPLANYDQVKETIQTWIDYTDLGPTKIMVSTVGILAQMKKLLTDPTWPGAQIAISLHSANQLKREEIVPTTIPNFLKELAYWSHEYERLLGNRNHKLTVEYTLISGVNDTPELAKELATYINKTAIHKVNVIPYNPVQGKPFNRAERERIDRFKDILRRYDVNVTERKTMGDDIAAACGQLALTTDA